jgi:hypothetical protein
MLYSKNGQHPATIPFRIVLSNGRTRTDPSTFTEEEILDAGFVPVGNPPTADYPQRVDWIDNQWVVRDPNEGEVQQRWDSIRSSRNQLLVQSDIDVLRSFESSVPVDIRLVEYRRALRDITLQPDPWNIIWPVKPDLSPEDEQ